MLWKVDTKRGSNWHIGKDREENKKKTQRDWRWNRKEIKASLEEEMTGFAMEMAEEIEEGWTAKKRRGLKRAFKDGG